MAECTAIEITEWSIDHAIEVAQRFPLRFGNRPYGFKFHTEERAEGDWDPRLVDSSPFYFLGGVLEITSEGGRQVITDAFPRFVQPFRDGDVLVSIGAERPDMSTPAEKLKSGSRSTVEPVTG